MLYLALEMSIASPLYCPAIGHKFKFKPKSPYDKIGDLIYNIDPPPPIPREEISTLIQIQLAVLQW